ncbi:MAG TPA: hypothetical protein VFJ52_03755 [Terriglobia bacterium]|nr:hypothetical protein [Terriglobia bacterium]
MRGRILRAAWRINSLTATRLGAASLAVHNGTIGRLLQRLPCLE